MDLKPTVVWTDWHGLNPPTHRRFIVLLRPSTDSLEIFEQSSVRESDSNITLRGSITESDTSITYTPDTETRDTQTPDTETRDTQTPDTDISKISTKTLNWFQERAILSPTNEQIDEINDFIFQTLKLHYKLITQLTVVDREEAVHYPTEFFDASRNSAAQINIKSRFPYYITKTLKSIKTVQRCKTQSCHLKKLFDRMYHINWQQNW